MIPPLSTLDLDGPGRVAAIVFGSLTSAGALATVIAFFYNVACHYSLGVDLRWIDQTIKMTVPAFTGKDHQVNFMGDVHE